MLKRLEQSNNVALCCFRQTRLAVARGERKGGIVEATAPPSQSRGRKKVGEVMERSAGSEGDFRAIHGTSQPCSISRRERHLMRVL